MNEKQDNILQIAVELKTISERARLALAYAAYLVAKDQFSDGNIGCGDRWDSSAIAVHTLEASAIAAMKASRDKLARIVDQFEAEHGIDVDFIFEPDDPLAVVEPEDSYGGTA